MRNTGRARIRLSGVVAIGVVLGLTTAGNALAAPLAPAAGDTRSCPAPGKEPRIGHEPRFLDANVALFAGGDYTADGATAEAEGLLVIGGNATFAKGSGGVFNVGRVGAGSGILPASGSVMLSVGGDLTIAKGTRVDVGHGLTAGPRYGGAVQVGGTIDVKGGLETNGGARSSGLGARKALSPYDTFGDTLRGESAALGALKPTGTTVRSGQSVTFKGGNGASGPQVFEISAKDLDGTSSFDFENIPGNSSVVVNVTGGQPVGISPLSVGFNGDRVDVYDSARFGEAASRILYNFEASPSITLGGGGNFMGSILAPKASADLTASTNGRVYVGGNLRTHGTGNESHNYPWNGSSKFSCKPTPDSPGTEPVPTPTATTPGTEPSSPAPSVTTPAGESPAPSAPETTAPGSPAPSAPSTEDASAPAAPGTTAPSPSATGAGDGSLATTGAQFTPYAIAAAVLGAVGAGILVLTRRRRALGRH
ncbi:choice-of-anchor A family protein [Streptomyces sp. NPDC001744]|uniref:choice-of-anchor A family protein n=1 Tax=Streptomyces sp. NPDC001744 TaxID=3364606 RepID=UPI00367C9BAA